MASQLQSAVSLAISRNSIAINRTEHFSTACVRGIVNSLIRPAPGQTRRAFSIREMLGSRDPSGNLRPKKTAESGGRRRVSGSFSEAATREWTDSYAGYSCEVRGTLLRREPKHVNSLAPPAPTAKPMHRGRNVVQRGAAAERRAARPLIGFPTGQFPVCRTPPRFPQQPFLGSNTRRPIGHSIKPTRRFCRDTDVHIDPQARCLFPCFSRIMKNGIVNKKYYRNY